MSKPWLAYHKRPITLHSGRKSHWFVYGERIFVDPNLQASVLQCWKHILRGSGLSAHKLHFIGIPTGGLCWAEAMAHEMNGSWGSPDDPRQGAVIVVDDVVTTGRSIGGVDGHFYLAAVVRTARDRLDDAKKYTLGAWCWLDLEFADA